MMRRMPTASPPAVEPRRLAELAIDALTDMEDGGLFCTELQPGKRRVGPPSLRYSLMTAIGLVRASRAGYGHPFDPARIRRLSVDLLEQGEGRAGDWGLVAWLDAALGDEPHETVVASARRRTEAQGGLRSLEGMELAWLVQGLVAAGRADDTFLREALDLLLGPNRAASGLFFHRGEGARRRFPNFATEIYSVLALSTAARAGADDRALPAAVAAADVLLRAQREDGGWPWLYDAERGEVVEPYEVYSVHQHAMAPMGLLELADVSRDDRYRAAAASGLPWVSGRNELGADMVAPHESMIYRSIRRRRPLSRIALYANTGLSLVGAPRLPGGGPLELHRVCRPYELGWLLEAWCGREELASR